MPRAVIAEELADPFWQTSFAGKPAAKSWGISSRSNPLAKLKGRVDDGGALEGPIGERTTIGETVPRVSLKIGLGKSLLGPGPQYATTTGFESSSRFSSFPQYQIQRRSAWGEAQASILERTRPKTPKNLLSMNPAEFNADKILAEKKRFNEKKKKNFLLMEGAKSSSSPGKQDLGPGCYDIDRPARTFYLSSLAQAARTKIKEGSSRRRKVINKTDIFEDRTDYQNYDFIRPLGQDAPKAFVTTEQRQPPTRAKTPAGVGPGCYDVVSSLRSVSPASPKARWLTAFTFSKDPMVTPFAETHRY